MPISFNDFKNNESGVRSAHSKDNNPAITLAKSRDPLSKLSGLTSQAINALTGSGISQGAAAANINQSKDNLLSGGKEVFQKGGVNRIGKSVLKDVDQRSGKGQRSVTAAINANRYNSGGAPALIYPNDLPAYHMSFSFSEYVRPNSFERLRLEPIQQIILPLPENLIESYSVTVDPVEDTGIAGEIANRASQNEGLITTVQQQIAENQFDVQSLANALGPTMAGVGARAGIEVLNRVGNLGELLTQYAGAIPNPHPTVFFKGVQLRSHTLNWKFSAQNYDESVTLRTIFNTFREMMLPEAGSGSLTSFLNYPKIVLPRIEGTQFGYPYKYCFVEQINIINTPDGGPAFFKSGAPVAYLITLQLREIEFFLANDQRTERTEADGLSTAFDDFGDIIAAGAEGDNDEEEFILGISV
jgi:hypothetical protein